MQLLKLTLVFFLSLLVISLFLTIPYVDQSLYVVLTNESRGVEILTAIFYLFGGILLLFASYRIFKGINGSYKKIILPILLGSFFIVVAGEEESWGQWIFEFSTPEQLQGMNYQNEVNFHNLDIFTGGLHANALLNRFVLLYGVVLPFIYVFSGMIRQLCDRFSLPVIPVYLTPIFISAFIYRQIVLSFPVPPVSESWRHGEVTEFLFSIGFLVFCIYFLRSKQPTLIEGK